MDLLQWHLPHHVRARSYAIPVDTDSCLQACVLLSMQAVQNRVPTRLAAMCVIGNVPQVMIIS